MHHHSSWPVQRPAWPRPGRGIRAPPQWGSRWSCAGVVVACGCLLRREAPFLHRRGAADDLTQLRGDLRLPRPVEHERDLLVHLARVLRGVLHGAHPLRRLRRGALQEGSIHRAPVVELVQVGPHLVDGRLEGVHVHRLGPLCLVHRLRLLQGDRVLDGGVVGHHGLEVVADDLEAGRPRGHEPLGHERGGGERPRHLARLLERVVESVPELELHRGHSLASQNEDLPGVALGLLVRQAQPHLLRHRRVHAAAQALVGSDGEVGDGPRLLLPGQPLHQVQHRLAKGHPVLHVLHVLLELGRGDHLHGLRDLFHVVDGLHADLQRLQRRGIPGLHILRAQAPLEGGKALLDTQAGHGRGPQRGHTRGEHG
mmetsp:Transcript_58349/g.151645  ORF Transcript_58349/g.151645 Transcript_58349/m.151645 type:complete len:369 (+) Transcript_58349:153-1259(+)